MQLIFYNTVSTNFLIYIYIKLVVTRCLVLKSLLGQEKVDAKVCGYQKTGTKNGILGLDT